MAFFGVAAFSPAAAALPLFFAPVEAFPVEVWPTAKAQSSRDETTILLIISSSFQNPSL
jgi:hypothetical protein